MEGNSAELDNIVVLIDETRDIQNSIRQAQQDNTQLLADLATSVDDVSLQLEQQREILTQMIEEQSAAISANQETLTDVRQQLLDLSADNIALAQSLQTQTSDLQTEIEGLQANTETDSEQLLAQQSELANLNAQVVTALADYNYLSALYATLKELTDENQSQLEELEQTVSALAVSGGGGSGGGNGPQVLTFTDTPNQDDRDHVEGLRVFLQNTETLGRWVGVVFTTPAANRTTELCFQDNSDLFLTARNTDDHPYTATDGGSGSYRLNNGDWLTTSVMRVQSRRDQNVDYVYVGAVTSDVAVAALTNFASGSPQSDSLHQRRYMTVELNGETVSTYTVAGDRLSACGY